MLLLISNFPSTLNLFSISISNNFKKIILLLNLNDWFLILYVFLKISNVGKIYLISFI